eukprot:155396-Chlamydomonas_euryale.AAC.13
MFACHSGVACSAIWSQAVKTAGLHLERAFCCCCLPACLHACRQAGRQACLHVHPNRSRPGASSCCAEAVRSMSQFNMKNMANLVWAYARVSYPCEPLFAAVGERAAAMLEDAEGRLLEPGGPDGVEVYYDNSGRRVERHANAENGGVATERVELRDGSVLMRDAPGSSNRLFVPQNLSDMAWAFADQGVANDRLFRLIAKRATIDIHHFSKTSLVDIAFGFATAKHYDQELFQAIEEFSLPMLPDFGPAYMSELLWSMATLGHRPGETFVMAAMEVTWTKWERVTSDRNWLAKTIWALLKLEADKVNPNHQLLTAFNDALGADDMHEKIVSTPSPQQPSIQSESESAHNTGQQPTQAGNAQ